MRCFYWLGFFINHRSTQRPCIYCQLGPAGLRAKTGICLPGSIRVRPHPSIPGLTSPTWDFLRLNTLARHDLLTLLIDLSTINSHVSHHFFTYPASKRSISYFVQKDILKKISSKLHFPKSFILIQRTRPRLARKHNIASEVGPTLQDAFFSPPRSICEASARQHQARCSAQTGRRKLVCASCSTQVALCKLLCASCSAQVAPGWPLQVAPCKLLCANCAPCNTNLSDSRVKTEDGRGRRGRAPASCLTPWRPSSTSART